MNNPGELQQCPSKPLYMWDWVEIIKMSAMGRLVLEKERSKAREEGRTLEDWDIGEIADSIFVLTLGVQASIQLESGVVTVTVCTPDDYIDICYADASDAAGVYYFELCYLPL